MDLAHLIRQRLNKVFRENLDFLFERFESQDLCSVVVRFYNSCILFLAYSSGRNITSRCADELIHWQLFIVTGFAKTDGDVTTDS